MSIPFPAHTRESNVDGSQVSRWAKPDDAVSPHNRRNAPLIPLFPVRGLRERSQVVRWTQFASSLRLRRVKLRQHLKQLGCKVRFYFGFLLALIGEKRFESLNQLRAGVHFSNPLFTKATSTAVFF